MGISLFYVCYIYIYVAYIMCVLYMYIYIYTQYTHTGIIPLEGPGLAVSPTKTGWYSGAAEIMAVGYMLISHDLPSKNLVGGVQ